MQTTFNPSCTTRGCPGNCPTRGGACMVDGMNGVCALVRFSDGSTGTTCEQCPTSCPNGCTEAPQSASGPNLMGQGAICGVVTTGSGCTDVACPCTKHADCGTTLVCITTKCQDPCAAWPCPADQACAADHASTTGNGAKCTTACSPPTANCTTANVQARKCQSGVCVLDGSVLLVASVSPSPGSRVQASTTTRITAVFNMNLQPSTVSPTTVVVKDVSGGTSAPVAGNLSVVSGNGTTLEFRPNGPFGSGRTIEVTLTPGLTCDANMPLASTFSWRFDTF